MLGSARRMRLLGTGRPGKGTARGSGDMTDGWPGRQPSDRATAPLAACSARALRRSRSITAAACEYRSADQVSMN